MPASSHGFGSREAFLSSRQFVFEIRRRPRDFASIIDRWIRMLVEQTALAEDAKWTTVANQKAFQCEVKLRARICQES